MAQSNKTTDFLKNALNKSGEVSKKAVDTIKTKTLALSEETKKKSFELRLKKYSPIFPDTYKSSGFNIPNLVIIVDDAIRKNIDVCQGAIGWLSQEKGVEVLHLYDEAIEFSELNFSPAPICDSVYYVDPHNRKHFINIDCYFACMQEEKLAELQHIAFSLGAAKYMVEVIADTYETSSFSRKTSTNTKFAESTTSEYQKTSTSSSKALSEAVFSNKRKPSKPNLCWFAKDKNILNLIDMRCVKGESTMSSYTIELNSSVSATMSATMAAKIDAAVVKMGMSCNFNKKGQEEHNQKMYFKLEF